LRINLKIKGLIMDEKGFISNLNNSIVDKNRTTSVNITSKNNLINTPDNTINESKEDIDDLNDDIELEWDDDTPRSKVSKDLAVIAYVKSRKKVKKVKE
jgi:hypothetical protein